VGRCTNSREGDADEDAEGDANSDGPSKLSAEFDRIEVQASGSAFYSFQTSRDRHLMIIHKVKMAVCRVNSADIDCGKNE
jgi:hypothetical protein